MNALIETLDDLLVHLNRHAETTGKLPTQIKVSDYEFTALQADAGLAGKGDTLNSYIPGLPIITVHRAATH